MRLKIVENKTEPLRSWVGSEDFNAGYRSASNRKVSTMITPSERLRHSVRQLQEIGKLGAVSELNELDAWLLKHPEVHAEALSDAEFVHDWVQNYRRIGDAATAWTVTVSEACEDLDCCDE